MTKRRKSSEEEVNETIAIISGNYPAFQYRFVEFITDHLADCSRSFGGDLQQMLVLAIIGQMELHVRTRAIAGGGAPATAISASRISDVTGIPRETVRRKLSALEKRGWIVRQNDGMWRLRIDPEGTSAARVDLHDLDQRSIARWAALLVAVKPLL